MYWFRVKILLSIIYLARIEKKYNNNYIITVT